MGKAICDYCLLRTSQSKCCFMHLKSKQLWGKEKFRNNVNEYLPPFLLALTASSFSNKSLNSLTIWKVLEMLTIPHYMTKHLSKQAQHSCSNSSEGAMSKSSMVRLWKDATVSKTWLTLLQKSFFLQEKYFVISQREWFQVTKYLKYFGKFSSCSRVVFHGPKNYFFQWFRNFP